MKGSIRAIILVAIFSLAQLSHASVILTLTEGPGGSTNVSASGSGTVTPGSGLGTTLQFGVSTTNDPFNAQAFMEALGGDFSINFNDGPGGSTSIDFTGNFVVSNGAILISGGSASPTAGLNYVTSGTMNIANLMFSTLNPGTFTFNTIDAARLSGGVEVRVVPLPAALWLFITAIGGLLATQKLRSRSRYFDSTDP
ncbi:MAG: hypothetical protein AAF541_17195 [Pseudomonadota bacterium]